MPYIDRKKRAQLDPAISLMLKALIYSGEGVSTEVLAGRLNYVITRLIMDSFFGYVPNYHLIAVATGVLETCKLEMYRRLAAPYEDERARENGDVYAH